MTTVAVAPQPGQTLRGSLFGEPLRVVTAAQAGPDAWIRALLTAEQKRSPAFLRLANVLSARYPRDSEEKRLLDGMLLAGSA